MGKIKSVLPEMYLVLSVIYYWMLTGTLLNPVAIVLLAVLVYQLISRNKISGIIISSIFVMLNCYLILALLSELSEFPQFNGEAKNMALVGFTYIGLNCIIGTYMFYSYIKLNIKTVIQ